MDYFKIVNVNAPIPVKTTTPPIHGSLKNVKMTYSDILKCLCRRATVHQVLSDGSLVQLTTKNFRYDFEADLQKRKVIKAEIIAEKDPKEIEKTCEYTKADKYKPVDEPAAEGAENVLVEEETVETGSIDEVEMLADIDEEDHSDAEEPEEPSAVEEETVEEAAETKTSSANPKTATKTKKKNSSKK